MQLMQQPIAALGGPQQQGPFPAARGSRPFHPAFPSLSAASADPDAAETGHTAGSDPRRLSFWRDVALAAAEADLASAMRRLRA